MYTGVKRCLFWFEHTGGSDNLTYTVQVRKHFGQR